MDISLDQARRRAKELLAAARSGDAEALGALRPDRDQPRLADAQRAVAEQLGHPSWPALVAHVEATSGDRAVRRARLLELALGGRWDRAERILAADPALAHGSLAVALATGDVAAVTGAVADAGGEVAEVGRKPLLVATHSAWLQPRSPRAGDVVEVVRLLLERGADPNATFTNEFGEMSALYGAAGVAHSPEATRLLLDSGADPDDGESVYHAVESEDTTCLRMLLEHGATVRETNAVGHALARPTTERLRLLLELGDLRPEDDELRPRLLHARRLPDAQLLLAHGADVLARDEDGLTPHDHAVRLGNDELAAFLAAAGGAVEPDANALWMHAVETDAPHAPEPPRPLRRSDAELLPMRASAGDDVLVARLLDAGVPIESEGVEGQAVHYAAMWGCPSTLELLLDRGAAVEAQGMFGAPIGYAAWGSRHVGGDGHMECVELLLARGAAVQPGMLDVADDEVAARLDAALR